VRRYGRGYWDFVTYNWRKCTILACIGSKGDHIGHFSACTINLSWPGTLRGHCVGPFSSSSTDTTTLRSRSFNPSISCSFSLTCFSNRVMASPCECIFLVSLSVPGITKIPQFPERCMQFKYWAIVVINRSPHTPSKNPPNQTLVKEEKKNPQNLRRNQTHLHNQQPTRQRLPLRQLHRQLLTPTQPPPPSQHLPHPPFPSRFNPPLNNPHRLFL
jgi:hypothetical protein